jgi:hydrogenase nickel incorporation protein HypA/HybF
MHEFGIMESALASVLSQARAHGGKQVVRVGLRVGALAGVEPEALRMAFEALAKGTSADGAVLDIESVPARGRCEDCDAEFDVGTDFIFSCPKCGRVSGELSQGRELDLVRIDLS